MPGGPIEPAISTSCGSGFTGLSGNFDAAMIDADHALGQAQRREFGAIRAESIGLDNLRAGLDVGLVHAEDGLGLR